jgi:hypothetical protein
MLLFEHIQYLAMLIGRMTLNGLKDNCRHAQYV